MERGRDRELRGSQERSRPISGRPRDGRERQLLQIMLRRWRGTWIVRGEDENFLSRLFTGTADHVLVRQVGVEAFFKVFHAEVGENVLK